MSPRSPGHFINLISLTRLRSEVYLNLGSDVHRVHRHPVRGIQSGCFFSFSFQSHQVGNAFEVALGCSMDSAVSVVDFAVRGPPPPSLPTSAVSAVLVASYARDFPNLPGLNDREISKLLRHSR